MNRPIAHPSGLPAAFVRLSALATLDPKEMELLLGAQANSRTIPGRRDILAEGSAIPGPILILAGWACRVRRLADGRRQILGFLLPGDLIGVSLGATSQAAATIATLTDVTITRMPALATLPPGSGLTAAYAESSAQDERNLLRQITRLGRMTAYERVADLMLELYERLVPTELADAGVFPLPVTQETLADALGLTSVHINRTIRTLREDDLLTLRAGGARLHDPARLAATIDDDPRPLDLPR